MWSTVANRSIVTVALGLPLFCATGAAAAQSESESKVVARLYKDYAWQAFSTQSELFGESLPSLSKAALEKYFAPDLAKLLAEDTACGIRTRELCNLDFDLLFDSQDPRITDLEVARLSPGKVRVQFKDPVTDETTRIEYKLITVRGKWRITDIIYSGHPQPSLKWMLSRPLPKS
jgi:hypothetical protein